MEIEVVLYPSREKKRIKVRKNTSAMDVLEKLGLSLGNVVFILNGKILPLDAKLSISGKEKIEIHSAFSGG
ncbi:MAG: MoaD/ThiS family protein [Thermoplasmata archaeon]